MTLDQGIVKYTNLAEIYRKMAKSKEIFNPDSAEYDRGTAQEYEDIVKWLEELKELRKLTYKAESTEVMQKAQERKCNECQHYVVKNSVSNYNGDEPTYIYGCELWDCNFMEHEE